ncbi:MAG: D-alanyl-D-alanine carboxypeptidase family protein [Pseudomonadota bacterium]
MHSTSVYRSLFVAVALVAFPHQLFAQNAKPLIETAAPYAILVDAGTGTVLMEKSADTPMAPASMAKLATQEYVFNEIAAGRISLDQEFQVSENAWRNGGAGSGGSTMFAELNSKISVRNLLRGAMIISANDACIVLAENLAGSESLYAEALTERAKKLGMTNSTFANSTGLPDPKERTTARDLAKLAIHIINTYPDFYKWYSEREFSWTIKAAQHNRNPLLDEFEGADGVKTGYTSESGYGVVGSAVQDGRRLVLVVNGLKTPKDRAIEAKKLLTFGFRAFEARKLFAANSSVGDASVFGGTIGGVPLVVKSDVSILVQRTAQARDIKAKVVYKGPVIAPVEDGKELARLQLYYNDVMVQEQPLYAGQAVEEGTMTQRAVDAAKELVRSLF